MWGDTLPFPILPIYVISTLKENNYNINNKEKKMSRLNRILNKIHQNGLKPQNYNGYIWSCDINRGKKVYFLGFKFTA